MHYKTSEIFTVPGHLEDLSVGRRLILKLVSKKYGVKVRDGFNLFSMLSSDGFFCDNYKEPSIKSENLLTIRVIFGFLGKLYIMELGMIPCECMR